ncbi:MAG: hypothetical protein LUG89_00165 [Methanosphaera sp.]|nr:hypothetical protein [Methanosphaera sp.]
MFNFKRRNKIKTLEPETPFIVNDIKLSDYDLAAVITTISIPVLFLVSLRLVLYFSI